MADDEVTKRLEQVRAETPESAFLRAKRVEVDAMLAGFQRTFDMHSDAARAWAEKDAKRRAAMTWLGRAWEDAGRAYRGARWTVWHRLSHAWAALKGEECERD